MEEEEKDDDDEEIESDGIVLLFIVLLFAMEVVVCCVLDVSLGAIDAKKFPATLNFIAPKGTEQGGAVQFKIKADVQLDENFYVRAGYSANADIVLEERVDVMSIKEGLLRYEDEEPYVEVRIGDGTFEKRPLKLGLSDGVNIEVLDGISPEDEIKIWNKASLSSEEQANK